MDYPAGTDDSQEQTTMRADLGRVTGHNGMVLVWGRRSGVVAKKAPCEALARLG